MREPQRLTIVALLLTGLITVPAATMAEGAYGSLARKLFGDTLEREHGIALLGFAHVTAVAANHDIGTSAIPTGRGRNVQPQGGVVQDEGLNLQHVGFIACKGAGCPPTHVFEPHRNVLSRATPLPAPRGERVIVDWAVSALIGEDGVFWKNKGFDDFGWNADNTHRLSITQWYLDVYLPLADGVSLLVGSWHSPLAAEIGYAFVPPNLFSSRSHAFLAGPSKHVGALAEVKLPVAPGGGLLSVNFGITSDWNSIDFGSGAGGPSFMFGARWRSADMRTWLDIETIYGNGEDDFGDSEVRDGTLRVLGGGSQYLALSSTDEYLDRFVAYLVLSHRFDDALEFIAEGVYGYQEGGDLAPSPLAITTDAEFYGFNLGLRRRLADAWWIGARAEWFRDEEAANVLWRTVGARGGDVYALTLNVAWEPLPHLLVRPELKLDHYTGGGHLFAPARDGRARHDTQLLGVLNLEFRF